MPWAFQTGTTMTDLKTSDFFYNLPEELIAQTPADPRDSSRMLVYNRASDSISHEHFYNIIDHLNKGDLLVINNTRVIPARIFGHMDGKQTTFEILLLKRLDYKRWEGIMRPARKARKGSVIKISDELSATVEDVGEYGIRTISFDFDGVFEDILDRVGNMPLPPYIHETLEDKERYQTVYSKIEGSAAAPTAGLHFTPDLMKKLEEKGVEFASVLLHIGLGTFRPVKAENILDHDMHTEYYEIDSINADKINRAKKEGRRVIAVGTTSVRTLESVADENGLVRPCKGDTNIFIYPGYKFKAVDALITNFHLPESTLIMLVSALLGREKTLEIYNKAVEEKYRFFSFGDSCFFE
jgi:S-adenosylmethionine:tRNA ribosyltransferase-isomerase